MHYLIKVSSEKPISFPELCGAILTASPVDAHGPTHDMAPIEMIIGAQRMTVAVEVSE